ncbi:hypothetical protein PRVXT_002447 [Proteinivorax tanatarense]|uniref:Uncharacterized protein n=1 Tax=Proteinivorax tanatarense TaxID=1260629 RepID=A0AAU7VKS5_9FIRM
MYWSAAPSVVKGVNDYPNIFISKEELEEFEDQVTHALVSINKSITNRRSRESISDFGVELYHINGLENVYINEKLINDGLLYSYVISRVTMIFQVIIWIVCSKKIIPHCNNITKYRLFIVAPFACNTESFTL